MVFLSMNPHETYDLKRFLVHQDRRLKEVYKKLRQFEGIAAEMVEIGRASCRERV